MLMARENILEGGGCLGPPRPAGACRRPRPSRRGRRRGLGVRACRRPRGSGRQPRDLPDVSDFLLRCNSQTVRISLSKRATQWFLVRSRCAALTAIKFQDVSIIQKNPHTPLPSVPFPAPAPADPCSALCLCRFASLTPCRNGIRQRVVLRVWILSRGTVCLSFICAVAPSGSIPLRGWVMCHRVDVLRGRVVSHPVDVLRG